MDDIFKDIEEAGEKAKGDQKIDLGPISVLAEKQAIIEGPENERHINRLYEIMHEHDISIKSMEEVLKKRRKDLFKVRQVQIPEMMKEFGLKSITTTSNAQIEIKGDVSVTVKDKNALFKHLRKTEFGDLIKNQVVVTVDNEEERKEVITELDKTSCSYEAKEGVHAATLKKHVKLQLAEGKQLPEEAVKVYEYEYSKLKL